MKKLRFVLKPALRLIVTSITVIVSCFVGLMCVNNFGIFMAVLISVLFSRSLAILEPEFINLILNGVDNGEEK